MIEQLRSAGHQLHEAWDNYYRVYSTIQDLYTQRKAPLACGSSPELSRQLDAEIAFISSYESKIQQLKVTISRVRNQSSALVPINSLPPEILTRVFSFVLAKPCQLHEVSYDDEMTMIKYPKYPDYLAQVCSLWRKIALSSPSLWCHIDLSPDREWFDRLTTRALSYATRTGELPIELHIAEAVFCDYHTKSTRSSYEKLCRLVSRISSRVETVEMFGAEGFGNLHCDILRILFCSHQPGLTKLALWSRGNHHDAVIPPGFFEGPRFEDKSSYFVPTPSKNQVESCFASLTVLHLRDIFPLWSSSAYRGLTDLRLMSSNRWPSIEKAELISILKSSPGLRILYFGLQIRGSISECAELTPVHLHDLQFLKIFTHDPSGPGLEPSNLLRILAPGTKPLRLLFNDYYALDSISVVELDKFFARSRVAGFYSPMTTPPISLLLRHAAHLECIILDSIDFPFCCEIFPTLLQLDESSVARPRSLHILTSHLMDDELHVLLACCPSGLVLHSCMVFSETSDKQDCTLFTEQELSDAFPAVKFTNDKGKDLTANWDLVD